MAERVVTIRGAHGAVYEIDLHLNPSIEPRIASGELTVVEKRRPAKREPEPEE